MIHDFCDKEPRSSWRDTKTPENPTGARPGQNIEDVERGPMEHLMFGDKTNGNWFSPFRSIKDLLANEHESVANRTHLGKRTGVPHGASSHNTEVAQPEADYVIDPITNRKVPKVATNAVFANADAIVQKPTPSTKSLKSQQFIPFNPPPPVEVQGPIFYDGPPPESELKEYAQVKIDSEPWDLTHEEHVIPSALQPTVGSEEYEKSLGQKGVSWHPNDSLVTPSTNTHLHSLRPAESQSGEKIKLSAAELDQIHEEFYKQDFPLNIYTWEPNVVDAAELKRYDAFRYNEPDGRPASAMMNAQLYDTAELQQYQAVGYNEPNGKPAGVAESESYDPTEVEKYQAFGYNEPNGLPREPPSGDFASRLADAAGYQPFSYNEPDGKPMKAMDMNMTSGAELSKYEAAAFEPDSRMFPKTQDEEEIDLKELYKYRSLGYDEPQRTATAEVDNTAQWLKDYDQELEAGHRLPYLEPTEQEKAEDLDLLRASDIRAKYEIAPTPQETSFQESVQWLSADKQLTGNYVRDFPEEFAQSWTAVTPEPTATSTTSAHSPLEPALNRHSKQPLQPALDRQEKRSTHSSAAALPEGPDLMSQEPQGLQTSYEKEVGSKTQPVLATQYGDISTASSHPSHDTATTSSTAAAEHPPPTLYKVLAYDPSTESISIAETTSSVLPDSSTPLTPAQVLLKLSHPSKFLHYFGPLQAAGYEIASGNEHVLVFRPSPSSTNTSPPPPNPHSVSPINPIDMTGSPSSSRSFPTPATGRFASPTGFVNYDFPTAAPAKHRFISNIDVRREEPVFSGGNGSAYSDYREKGGKKRSVPKRMVVGAAWVAGISYALGTVGEYFRTGGVDGMGPKGF